MKKPQPKEFKPDDRRLTLAILNFSRLLLENCTNRNLYASYEVCPIVKGGCRFFLLLLRGAGAKAILSPSPPVFQLHEGGPLTTSVNMLF